MPNSSDFDDSCREAWQRGIRAQCEQHGLIYPYEQDDFTKMYGEFDGFVYEYTNITDDDDSFIGSYESWFGAFNPANYEVDDALVAPLTFNQIMQRTSPITDASNAVAEHYHSMCLDDVHRQLKIAVRKRIQRMHVVDHPADYAVVAPLNQVTADPVDDNTRDHWIAHYDAMLPCFAELTKYPDDWYAKEHAKKHGNQPWWEPRWATLAYGETQWTGCDEGLCERVSDRCRPCYAMRERAESTGAKEYFWCRNCPCDCDSLETCWEFPDHGESRWQHATAMKSIPSAISSLH